MEIGDIVRLKRNFRPEPDCLKSYGYAAVVGLVPDEHISSKIEASKTSSRSQFGEVIVQLYDPETATFYTDEFGTQPMFHFRTNELVEDLES